MSIRSLCNASSRTPNPKRQRPNGRAVSAFRRRSMQRYGGGFVLVFPRQTGSCCPGCRARRGPITETPIGGSAGVHVGEEPIPSLLVAAVTGPVGGRSYSGCDVGLPA